MADAKAAAVARAPVGARAQEMTGVSVSEKHHVVWTKSKGGRSDQLHSDDKASSAHATKHNAAKEKAVTKQSHLNGGRPADEKFHKSSSGKQNHQAKSGVQDRGSSSSYHLNGTTVDKQLTRTRHPLDSNSTGKDCKESHVREPKYDSIREAKDLIQSLNKQGLGENISPDEYIVYFHKLPNNPFVNTYFKLSSEQMIPLYVRHARYRINYYKFSQRTSTDRLDCDVDLLEKEDFSEEFLHDKRYFVKFEKDGTFDWSFDPDLCTIRDLDDYQRLVPHKRVGRYKYTNWDLYRKTFHSYETEMEYLDYCSELSEKLKWMEDYVLIEAPRMWGTICTRGSFQAMKIATAFSKITPSLVVCAYDECVLNMKFNAFWLKSLVDFYFEIWVMVTKQKKSMKCVVEELYNLNKFPQLIFRLKNALDYGFSKMETDFRTFTNNVPSGVKEDEAYSLIKETIKKVERPKFYDDYIRKKIDIAQAIGLIPGFSKHK